MPLPHLGIHLNPGGRPKNPAKHGVRNHLVGSLILLFTGLTIAAKSPSVPPFLPLFPPPLKDTPPSVSLLVSPNLVPRSAGEFKACCSLNGCVPPDFICGNITPNVMTVGGESLVNEVMRMKSHDGISAFIRDPRDFPSSPRVKNPPSNAGGRGSIPGWGTKIPYAMGQPSLSATIRKPACHNY